MNAHNHPDPAWLESQYNNRTLVPEHATYFERWTRESVLARQAHDVVLDVAYGSGGSETLDIFPAAGCPGTALAPVLVFVHGGYWRSMDKADHSFLAPAFVKQGTCVVVPNYALCPAVSIADITMQMVKALAWVYRHIGSHGGDPRRITVVGHSAGGHLCAMLLTCQWPAYQSGLPAALVKNALSVSGLYDLEPLRHTPFLAPSLRLTPAQVKKASPALLPAPAVQGGRGVLYSVAGGSESSEFLRQNRLIEQAWGKEGVPVCEALPGLNHFSVLDALVQPGHRLHGLALKLLTR